MRWIQKNENVRKVVDESLVQKKPKAKMDILTPEQVVKKKKAKKVFVLPREEIKTKKRGIHEDSIPPGTLCYLRKRGKEYYGFEYCTVLNTIVGPGGKRAYAEVLTPDGQVKQIDIMYLRNMDVQNGNVDEE